MDHSEMSRDQLIAELNAAKRYISELETKSSEAKENEARLRALAHALPDLVVITDHEGTVHNVIATQQELLTLSADELIGKNVHSIVPSELAARLMTVINKTLDTMETQAIEYELDVRAGLRWFDARTAIVPSPNDEDQQVIFVIRDITERKHAEEALLYQANLLDNISEAVIAGDDDYIIRRWNKAAERLYGWKEEEVLGKNATELLQTEYPDNKSVADVRELINSQGGWEGEAIHRRKSGEQFPVYIFSNIVRNAQGEVIGKLAVIRDMMEYKRTEQQRLDLLLEKERVQLLSAFINQASHEFMTPLSIITTSTYMLGKVGEPDERQRHLKKIEAEVYNLSALVDKLIIMCNLDKGYALQTSEVDLEDVVRIIYDAMLTESLKKELRMSLELGTPPIVQVDSEFLGRAIGSIWDNAIKFTPPKGTVTVRTYHNATHVIVEIADTGIGISEEDLPLIFERFYRSDKAGTQRGFGLGLSIAKAIVELHQGHIEVESTVDEGCTFRILLPY